MTTSGLDPDRLAALRQAKAAAMVSRSFGVADVETVAFPDGAAVVGPDADGRLTVWVLRAERAGTTAGPAAALAVRRHADVLHVIVDQSGPEPSSAADLGQAAHRIAVLGRSARLVTTTSRLDADIVSPVEPEPPTPPPPASAAALARADVLAASGIEVVVEQGIVRGEVLGLEVARVVEGPEGAAIEAGVGRFDREAGALLRAGSPESAALAGVIDQVRAVRFPGAPPHALNRMGRERWLRCDVVADPALVGCRELTAVEPARPRTNLRDSVPAPAIGDDGSGARVLVVCAAGVDLELVPDAAVLVDRHHPDRVVLAVPPRDHLPVLDTLAELLAVPTAVVDLGGSWSS